MPQVRMLVACCDEFAEQFGIEGSGWSTQVEIDDGGASVTCFTWDSDMAGMRFCPWCGKRLEVKP